VTILIAPLPAASAELGPLASGGAAGIRQAQAENDPPGLWLAGAGAVVALGTMLLMNNNGGAVVSGTIALSGSAPRQGASIPGAMAGGNGQSGSGAGVMSGGAQSGGAQSGGADADFLNSSSNFISVSATTTTTTTGTQ
jgi:hypothetical protein